MHPSALRFGSIFFETYCNERTDIVIVDIGSQDVNGSLRDVSPNGASYIGVDFVVGRNVDIVLDDPYKLPFDDSSIDVVVCSSVFEHSQFFWVLFLEIIRIMKPKGLFYLNVPSNGYIHRYPVDCWRFYPDSGSALVAWAEHNGYRPALLESFVSGKNNVLNADGLWNDFVAVIIKDKEFSYLHGARVIQSASGYTNAHCDIETIKANDSFLSDDFLLLNEGKNKISVLDRAVAERDGQIASLKQFVAERDTQIASLNQFVAERDTQIASLNQFVAERDAQIASLKQFVAERDAQIASLNQFVAERDAQIASLKQFVAERDAQIASLNQRYAEALRTIEEIRGSSSWRITAPLRFISSKATSIASLIKLLPRIIRFGGGALESAKKAWRVFSREGWAGVKQRILFVGGNRSGISSSIIRPDLRSGTVDRNDYSEWVRRYDTLTDESRATMRARIDAFSHKPLISVLMPTYNPRREWLIEAIESVRKQIYPHWELCIADDASTDKTVRPILEHYAKEDSRIKVAFRKKNGHISASSNTALQLATGDWVALLDHDDLLSEHALFRVADAINRNPDIRLIYSDEDKIDENGKRFDPYFKCEWNLDLFYSHNMFSHLGVYRTDLLHEINGFRVGLEGSQDHDLALRCIERIESNQIHHIPRVLYHWRVHAESTAQSADAKPYATLAGERALNEHFQRQKINASAEHIGHGYRVNYALPDILPMVSLIIPSRNGLQLLRTCVESILKKTTYPNYEVLIVDNGSDDPAVLGYLDDLQARARVRVMRDDRPFNYSALNNAAAKLARGEVLGLLNNDLEVISPDWLLEMVSHAIRPNIGAVGAKLWYPNDMLQHGGVILGLGGVAGHAHHNILRGMFGYFGRAKVVQNFSAVTAACLLVRKSIYEEVGGLNEPNLQVAFNDVDFCLRVREAGYRNIWTPYAELYHHESATRGFEDTPEKQARFAREVQYMTQRWGEQLLNDPAYSPNLTLDHGDFSLAWPPRVNI